MKVMVELGTELRVLFSLFWVHLMLLKREEV